MEPSIVPILTELWRDLEPVFAVVTDPRWADHQDDPDRCDFLVGNPHDLAQPAFVDALAKNLEPRDPQWFAYTHNDPAARGAAASMLRDEGLAVADEDVFLTPGTFGALAVAMRTLVGPGDEVVYVTPPWFFYNAMIRMAGGTAVPVAAEPPGFDLPVEAIEAAITDRTRVVLVNSPHNPSGRVYQRPEIERLADVLRTASDRNGQPVMLLSDESYRRILFDDRDFLSPAAVYPWTLLLYTLGKTLLTPGERAGFIALAPDMPSRENLRDALFLAQIVGGWQFPNALTQHALEALLPLSIDLAALQRRRDRLGTALREAGYEIVMPEGTFYMLVRSPIPDDRAFCESLVERNVFCLPGVTFELPGWFRISLTATDEMVERSIPRFAEAIASVR